MPQYQDFDISITHIMQVRQDFIIKGRPYIQLPPRNWNTLTYHLRGHGLFILNGQAHKITEGQIQFFRSGLLNRSEAIDESMHYIYINFETIDDSVFKALPLDFVNTVNDSEKYLADFQAALKFWNQQNPGHIIQCKEIIYRLLNNLIQEKFGGNVYTYKYRKIKKALIFMNNNLRNPDLTVTHAAEQCEMSVRSFNRIFHEVYHETPRNYLTRLRMDYAKELLHNASNSISDIAELTGFNSIYSFSRAFSRYTGIPPSKWSETSSV